MPREYYRKSLKKESLLPSEIKRISYYLDSDMSINELARRFGRSTYTIKRIAEAKKESRNAGA